MRGTESRRTRGAAVRIILPTLLVGALTTWALVGLPAPKAYADIYTFLINSASDRGDDINPGDGQCAISTTTPTTCTLRAALQEANQLAVLGDTKPVTITVAPNFSGTIALVADTPKLNTTYNSGLNDSGAIYAINAPYLTLDFAGRLGMNVAQDTPTAIGVLINAPHVVVQGFTNIVTAESSIAVTAAGTNALIQNGTFSSPYLGERAVVIDNGVTDLTIRDITIHEMYGDGAIQPRGGTVTRLRMERVTMDNVGTSSNNHYYGLYAASYVTLKDSLIRDCNFLNFPASRTPLFLDHITLDGTVIEQNQFKENLSGSQLIYISRPTTAGTSYIRNNHFRNLGTSKSSFLVNVDQGISANTPNSLIISDNTFQAMTTAAPLRLNSVGNLRAQRNMFGPGVYGGDAITNETNYIALLYNANYHANSQITTYYPTSATYDPGSKTVTVAIAPSVTTTLPTNPVTVDLYYTPASTTDAQMYLGRVLNVSGATTVSVPWTHGGGKVRVHTIDALGRSSQYSHSVPVAAMDTAAGPSVTVERAPGQAATTSTRRIQYIVTFSAPPTGLSAASFSLDGSTAPGARVTELRGVGRTIFVVSVEADGSGDLRLSLPAGAVTDGGSPAMPSQASTSQDNVVHYQVPLTVGTVQGIVAQRDCASYPVTVAPVSAAATYAPEARIEITPTVTSPFPVTITPDPAYIERNQTSVTFTVCADAGASVTNGTITVSHTVASADGDYDGIIVPDVTITATDMTPRWTLTMASSPVDTAAVSQGATVTYTATATHTGGYETEVTLSVDLSGALDDATWVAGSATLSVDGTAQPVPSSTVPDAAGLVTLPAATLAEGGTLVATVQVQVSTVTGSPGDQHVRATVAPVAPQVAPDPCQASDPSDTSCRTATVLVAAVQVSKTGPATLTSGQVTDPGAAAPGDSPATVTHGQTVTWAYTVTNVGAAPLIDLQVSDDQGVAITCPDNTLAAGASMVCHGSGTPGGS